MYNKKVQIMTIFNYWFVKILIPTSVCAGGYYDIFANKKHCFNSLLGKECRTFKTMFVHTILRVSFFNDKQFDPP